ncbi:MAG: hypothetical protein GTO22_25675 [Gemmatimonadales bacterium]|nr:hypothetical protein [Gemmatimonadales bacterium]
MTSGTQPQHWHWGKGVHPKIVVEMLGHSQIAITPDFYSHVTPTMHRQAAGVLEAVLGR